MERIGACTEDAMERRAFLCDAGAVALGVAWQAHPLALALAGSVPRANAASGTLLGAASVAVFDRALGEGRALAYEAARAGCVAWAVGDESDESGGDVGALWHRQMAQRLAPGTAVTGALRPSDRFVLARLAAARRVTLHDFACTLKNDSPGCARRT
jgi:hypothetical protein